MWARLISRRLFAKPGFSRNEWGWGRGVARGFSTRHIVAAALLTVVGTPLLTAALAGATQIHRPLKSFTLAGGSASPLELAINQTTGEVYATSFGAGTVYAFEADGSKDPTHSTLTEADGLTPYPFSNPYGVAVDNSGGSHQGNIYVANFGAGTVLQFGPSGARTAEAAISATAVPAEGTSQSSRGLPPVVNNGSFTPTGVAVSPNGDVYVADETNNVVDIFEPTGAFASQIGSGLLQSLHSLTVDSHGNLFVSEYGPGVVELDHTGACVNSCIPIGGASLGVAVDSEGHVYNDEVGAISEFNSSGVRIDGFGSFNFGRGVDVNESSGDVYVADESSAQVDVFEPVTVPTVTTGPTANFGQTSITLTGIVDPDLAHGGGPVTSCHFEYGTNTSYGDTTACLNSGDEVVGTPASPITGRVEVHTTVNLEDLNPATSYHYRTVASDHNGTTDGEDRIFETVAAAPSVSESVGEVHSESALVSAKINPGGIETTFHFEYGTVVCSVNPGSCTSVPMPEVNIGAGTTAQSHSELLTGLTPGTIYHVRVVATNILGTGSHEVSFTTFPFVPKIHEACPNALARQQTGAALLLDCRAYELVSSAESGGYDVESNLVPGQTPYGGYPLASGADGTSRFLYGVHDGALPGVAGHPTNKGIDPYIATRGPEGWTTTYVGIPADDPVAAKPFSSVPSGASAGLETFAFGGPEGCSPCFGPGGIETGIPVRLENGELIQGMVPAKGSNPSPSATADGYIAQDLSANGEHLIFGSTSAFAPGANNEDGDVSIYDHNLKTGETHVISNTPTTEDFPSALPCLQGKGQCSAAHKDSNGIAELAISKDGSHILLGQNVSTDAEGNVYWHLYMDVNDSITSIDLTPGVISEHGGPGFGEGVLFDGMTGDGSKVFFTTTDKMLGADTDESADIYEAEVSGSSAMLHLISTGEGGAPSNSNACEPVSNENGEHWNTVGSAKNCDAVAIGGGGGVAAESGAIYFLSPENLTEPATCGLPCATGDPTPNQPNLYLTAPGAAPVFIATLDPNDPMVLDAVKEAETRHTADFQVTPSGEFAVFTSTLPLSGYANEGYAEAYRYDAVTAQLDCTSCNPTNAQATSSATLASDGQSLTDDGRVFFNTANPLELRDTNERQNVYEWEPRGTGTCQPESPSFSNFTDACVSLISSGQSPFDSKLLGVSADGTDAYFFTHDSLAAQDHNGPTTKIYDARTDGGFFEVPKPPPCAASDECHGPGSQTPGSTEVRTNAGSPADYTPPTSCRRGFVSRHGRCVRKPHKPKRRHRRATHRHHGGGK